MLELNQLILIQICLLSVHSGKLKDKNNTTHGKYLLHHCAFLRQRSAKIGGVFMWKLFLLSN